MMNFEKYKPQHFDEIIQLFYFTFTNEPWNDGWKDVDHALKYIKEILSVPNFKGYLIISNDKIVGFTLGHIVSWWKGPEYYIQEMCVHPDFQRQGIGTLLINKIKESLVNENIYCITLLTDKNIFSYDFYKKNNFKKSENTIFMALDF